jgi:hypothetical protein
MLEQQRYDDDALGARPLPGQADDLGADQRVQQPFEARSRPVVREDETTQGSAVDLAVGSQDARAECVTDRDEPRLSDCGQAVRENVGVDDLHAQRCECAGNGRLSAADPTGQTDDVRHGEAGK